VLQLAEAVVVQVVVKVATVIHHPLVYCLQLVAVVVVVAQQTLQAMVVRVAVVD
jgi:hypothetical protein